MLRSGVGIIANGRNTQPFPKDSKRKPFERTYSGESDVFFFLPEVMLSSVEFIPLFFFIPIQIPWFRGIALLSHHSHFTFLLLINCLLTYLYLCQLEDFSGYRVSGFSN